MSSDTPTLIMICGPSGSGKSTLAKRLGEELGAVVIHQDDYFVKTFLRYRDRVDDTFEGPENVDWPRLRGDVMRHLRESAVVVEGHLLAMDQELVESSRLCVVLRCTEEMCKARRVDRRPRPEDERQELADYIDEFVWPSFLKYGQPALEKLEANCIKVGKAMMVLDASALDADKLADEVLALSR